MNNIIPFIEENYSVSKEAKDRVMCGLSMGSMTTNQMIKTYPDEFGYFGSFSGGSVDLDETHYDAKKINNAKIYLTAGNIDMAYNNNLGISAVDYMKMYDKIGVNYDFDLLLGSHDLYVWRESFSKFAKDYLWDVDKKTETPTEDQKPSVKEDNKNQTTTKTETAKKNQVKTGDNTSLYVYTLGLMLGLYGIYYFRKKKHVN